MTLDKKMVPYFAASEKRLNSYVTDLYKHKSRRAIAKCNGLANSQLYDVFYDVVHNLNIISEGLERRAGGELGGQIDQQDHAAHIRSRTAESFAALAESFQSDFKKVFAFKSTRNN